MRIMYQDGKLLVSLSDDEVDKFYKNKHTPVELPIGFSFHWVLFCTAQFHTQPNR